MPGTVLILVLRAGGDIVPDLKEVRYVPGQSSVLKPDVGAVGQSFPGEAAHEALKTFLHSHSFGAKHLREPLPVSVSPRYAGNRPVGLGLGEGEHVGHSPASPAPSGATDSS